MMMTLYFTFMVSNSFLTYISMTGILLLNVRTLYLIQVYTKGPDNIIYLGLRFRIPLQNSTYNSVLLLELQYSSTLWACYCEVRAVYLPARDENII